MPVFVSPVTFFLTGQGRLYQHINCLRQYDGCLWQDMGRLCQQKTVFASIGAVFGRTGTNIIVATEGPSSVKDRRG